MTRLGEMPGARVPVMAWMMHRASQKTVSSAANKKIGAASERISIAEFKNRAIACDPSQGVRGRHDALPAYLQQETGVIGT